MTYKRDNLMILIRHLFFCDFTIPATSHTVKEKNNYIDKNNRHADIYRVTVKITDLMTNC